MKRAALGVSAACTAALAVPTPALAHGLGGITNLPVPGWLFLVGGGTVLVVSFVALGGRNGGSALPATAGRFPALQRLLLSKALRIGLQGLGVGLFLLVWTAAAFGSERVILNLAPTFVYVVFWVGMTVLVVVLGNVWAAVDPWRAIAGAAAR